MAVTIQLRGDTAAAWTAANPTLAEREMALETDTDKFKIGDGVTPWTSLPYGGLPGATGPAGEVVGGVDGGVPNSLYGGTNPIDGGTP
jgi:hypothetical protein